LPALPWGEGNNIRFPIQDQSGGKDKEVRVIPKRIFCLSLALALFFFNLQAEENREKEKQNLVLQHEVVVTATRLETPIKEVASSITVITREELERARKTSVLEALEEILGVSVIQNGPKGGAASAFLRGANSEHTLVMMDGVELNDPISPSHSFDLAHLTLEGIERIEVLRGPQSTLYGSDALGGVINIITRKGQGKPKFHLSTEAGSYRTLSTSAGISGGSNRVDYSLGISLLQSQGFSAASKSYDGNKENDGYQNLSLFGRVGFRLKNNIDFELAARNLKTETDLDDFGGPYGDDPNNSQNYDSLLLKAQVRSLQLHNRWEQKMIFSAVDYDRRHKNPIDDIHPFDSEQGFYKSRLYKFEWQNNFFLHETNTLTFGIDHHQEQGESEYQYNSSWGPFFDNFPLKRAQTTAFFIQDQVRAKSRFFATIGFRLDRHSQFGLALTGRLAGTYLIESTKTKIKMTCGTGFKSPSLYQLYAPGTIWGPIGNMGLRPERSVGLDFGVEQGFVGEKILFAATYYLNDYRNLINFDSYQGYINIGRAEAKGIELSLQARPLDDLRLNLNFATTEARDEKTGKRLLRRPKEKFVANLNYQFLKQSNFNLSVLYIGERDDMDFSKTPYEQITLPAYALVNAAVSVNIMANIQVFSRFENIFNQKYEMIKGYGTPGFSVYGGFNLLF
jgi:vitamin B12 transporter